MRHVYIITEGVQDATVAGKALRVLISDLAPVSRRREVSAFWDGIIPTSFPGRIKDKEDQDVEVFGRIVVPDFFQNEEISVAIQNSGGLSKLANVIRSDFDGLPVLPDAIGIIIDADGNEIQTAYKDLVREINTIRPDWQFAAEPGQMKPGPPKLGAFILPNNSDRGTLEDTMLECAQNSYPQLLPVADDVVSRVEQALHSDINWLPRPERNSFKKPFGPNKTKISILGAIMKPTYAVQNTYREHEWITPATITQPKLALLASFLKALVI